MQENMKTETEGIQEETPAEEAKPLKGDKKKIKKLEEELAAAKKETEELNERYLRMLAEYDNFRKRSAKERDGIYTDAYIDALTSILPVLDNLERAEACGESEALAKGLELTLKSFGETMEKMGVNEIPALGEKFDPNVHNAVMHVDDDSFGENEVVEVFMKGDQKGDKVLRYSMVKVAN